MSTSRRPLRRAPAPVQNDGVTVMAAGAVAWAIAFAVLLALRSTLDDHDAGWWVWIPVAGVCIGLIGIALALRHRARTRS